MSIFEHDDYRRFLVQYIQKLPKKGRGEILKIANYLAVHPSLISQVLGRNKNLSLEQAQLICEYYGLTLPETDYLLCTVEYHRAGSDKLRKYFKNKLNLLQQQSVEISKRVRQDRQLTSEEKSVLYSHWNYLSVWLFSSLKNGCDLKEVCDRFTLSRERAFEILSFLVETQLCTVNEGRYFMSSKSVHLERKSPHLSKHHTNWRLKAIEYSDKISTEELMYTAPFSVSKSDFGKIRARLADVIKEFADIAIQSEAEDLACFNLDFFWLSKIS